MESLLIPDLDDRLQRRYRVLVRAHMKHSSKLAPGVAALPGESSAFAATQAAWRFLNNDRVSLPALVEPLREVGRQRLADEESPFALLVHDWSKLSFQQPRRKQDLAQLTHASDVGYELTVALLVSSGDGQPIAPMEVHLKTGQGVLSTRNPTPADAGHLEQVLPTMTAAAEWKLAKPLLHIVDREADSVDHFRQWDAAGYRFLIRGDDRRVTWQGKSCLLSRIRDCLDEAGRFSDVGDALYQGHRALLSVVETPVRLDRPARKNVKGQRFDLAGQPLELRFIAVRVHDPETHDVLADWFLLTNAPPDMADAAKLAHCYYWRWRIESFFKLLKSHGLELEQWQQATGKAIARRLLIAAMACVTVWQLQADESPEATELKDVLVRLSGRQTKRSRPHTSPALLAGLWVLLSMLSLLDHYDLHDLRRLTSLSPFLDSS